MADKLTIHKCDCFGVGRDVIIAVTPLLTDEELKDLWIHYRDVLIEEQVTDISEFTRWNFYLFYVVSDKNRINRSLKYEIEHNTISSRKILVNKDEVCDGPASLIAKYIKYEIVPGQNNARKPSFQKNTLLKNTYKQNEDQED